MSGYLYSLDVAAPAAVRARGLDAAHRIARRVQDTVQAALEADPEVLAIEDRLYFREAPWPCDRTARCRGNLHQHDCAGARERT